MKATIQKIGNGYEIIGLDAGKVVNGITVYEMRYLFTFGGKQYKTEENAIRAIARKGFEYLPVNQNQLRVAQD